MATELQVFDMSLDAAGDFYTTSKQYYVMKVDSNGRAALAGAANAASIGILQNKPKQYEAAEVRNLGISKAICGGAITCGNKVTGNTDSEIVEAASGERYIGIALETGEDSRIISILMDFGYLP